MQSQNIWRMGNNLQLGTVPVVTSICTCTNSSLQKQRDLRGYAM